MHPISQNLVLSSFSHRRRPIVALLVIVAAVLSFGHAADIYTDCVVYHRYPTIKIYGDCQQPLRTYTYRIAGGYISLDTTCTSAIGVFVPLENIENLAKRTHVQTSTDGRTIASYGPDIYGYSYITLAPPSVSCIANNYVVRNLSMDTGCCVLLDNSLGFFIGTPCDRPLSTRFYPLPNGINDIKKFPSRFTTIVPFNIPAEQDYPDIVLKDSDLTFFGNLFSVFFIQVYNSVVANVMLTLLDYNIAVRNSQKITYTTMVSQGYYIQRYNTCTPYEFRFNALTYTGYTNYGLVMDIMADKWQGTIENVTKNYQSQIEYNISSAYKRIQQIYTDIGFINRTLPTVERDIAAIYNDTDTLISEITSLGHLLNDMTQKLAVVAREYQLFASGGFLRRVSDCVKQRLRVILLVIQIVGPIVSTAIISSILAYRLFKNRGLIVVRIIVGYLISCLIVGTCVYLIIAIFSEVVLILSTSQLTVLIGPECFSTKSMFDPSSA